MSPGRFASFPAHENGVTSASFSPNGATLATGGYDGVVRLWDTNSWRETQALPGHRRGHVAFAPDGARLISGGLHKDAVVFDTSTWEVIGVLAASGGVWSLAYRPDGSQIVLIEPNEDSEERAHRPVEFWDPHSLTMTGTANVGTDDAYAVAFSTNGQFATLAHAPGGSVSLWSADFARRLHLFQAHNLAAWGLAFAPDGKTLATGGADNVARLWDTASWEMRHEITYSEFEEAMGYNNGVLCAAFSPDGSLLVTGGLDGMLTVWRL